MIGQKVDHLLEQLQAHQGSDDLLVGANTPGRDPQLTFGNDGSWTSLVSWSGWRVARIKPEEQTCLLRQLQNLAGATNLFLQTRDIKADEVNTLDTEDKLTKANVLEHLKTIKSSHKYVYDMTLDALNMAYMDHSHLGNDAEITHAVRTQVLENLKHLPAGVMKAILPGALRSFAEHYEGPAVKDVCAIVAATYDVEFTPPVKVKLDQPRPKPAAKKPAAPVAGQPIDIPALWQIPDENTFDVRLNLITSNAQKVDHINCTDFTMTMRALMGVLHYGQQHWSMETGAARQILNCFEIWLKQASSLRLTSENVDFGLKQLAIIEAAYPGINTQPLREVLQPFSYPPGGHPAAALPPQSNDNPEMTEEQRRRARDWEALAGPQVVRHYGNLGKGNFGTVGFIKEGHLGRARKVAHNQAPENLANMERERQIMSHLNHPHILRETGGRPVSEKIKVTRETDIKFDEDGYVLARGVAAEQDKDAFVVVEGVDDEMAGIQTEVVSDGDLDLKGELYHSLSWEERLKCCKQLLEAIAYMHEEGVAHLDLKPDNILYSRRDGVKVGDFGLSQFMYQTTNIPNLIRNDGIIDMPHAAPERARYRELDGSSADVWSLALTMAELLTGDSPLLSDVVTKGFQQVCPQHAPKGFIGLLTDNEIDQGVHAFLVRQGQTLGSLGLMFWEMFSPDPRLRITAREALDKYGHLFQEGGRSPGTFAE